MKVECWDEGKCWLVGEVITFLNDGKAVVKGIREGEDKCDGWLYTVSIRGIKVIEDKE